MKKKIIAIALSVAAVLAIISAFYFGKNNISLPQKTAQVSGKVKHQPLERTKYNMDLNYKEENQTITGHEVVKFENKYGVSLSNIVLHLYADSYNSADTMPQVSLTKKTTVESKDELGDISINSVKTNCGLKNYTQNNQVLKITLKKPLKAGMEISINIDFVLKIPKGKLRLGYFQNVISVTNWYPILSIYDKSSGRWDEEAFCPIGESNYSESSDYKINITVPKGMILATTGVKTSENKSGDKDKYTFEAKNNRDFDMFMSKDYKVVSAEADGIKVNSYYISDESSAKRMLNLACDTLKFFDKEIGKYPFSEYDIAETYLSGGDMEYPTITQMGDYPKMSENYNSSNFCPWDEAVIHETIHQWWYSTVGNNEFKEAFLDESLTSYFTAYFEDKNIGGKTQYIVSDNRSSRASEVKELQATAKMNAPIVKDVDKFSNLSDYVYSTYQVAPRIIEGLRKKVGDDKFMDIFREYYKEYEFKIGNMNDLYKVIEDKCGKEDSDYFKSFLTDSK